MNEEMIFFATIILWISFAFFWIIFKIFRINRPGLSSLLAIIISFVLSPFHPFSFVVAVMPFALGYKAGRSTSLPVNPTDTFSSRVKVDDVEYRYRSEQFIELIKTYTVHRFLLSENVPWPDKMSLLYTRLGFSLYKGAPVIALLTSSFYLIIWNLVNLEGELMNPLSFLLFMLSLPYGTAMGELIKYIKGHRYIQSRIEGQTFKPTIRSFILSFIYDISPAVTAALVTYFTHGKAGLIIIIPSALMGLFSLYLILQTIFVHLQKITVLNEGILISGFRRPYGLRWTDVEKAEIRERHNIISGTDKLLILYSKYGHKIAYPISILSKNDQNNIDTEIRKKIPTSTKFDRPTL